MTAGGSRLSRTSIDLYCCVIRDFLETNYDDFESIAWLRLINYINHG